MAVGLFERLGFPSGRATKVIDGQHPEPLHTHTNAPKPDMLPLPSDHSKKWMCRNILVASSGTDLDTEIVTIASNLAKTKKSSVFVVYGIEVPRKLAIDAEMAEQTQRAAEALDRMADVAEQMGVHIEPEIVQSRHFGQSLVDEAAAHDCALLILGLPYNVGLGGHFDLGDTADYVLKNASCRVWLVRGDRTEAPERGEKAERSESGVGAGR